MLSMRRSLQHNRAWLEFIYKIQKWHKIQWRFLRKFRREARFRGTARYGKICIYEQNIRSHTATLQSGTFGHLTQVYMNKII